MFKQGIGDTEIAFCIFKIDRIYFMRHGRRTYFAFYRTLLEIFHRNIGPHITAEIDQYVIDPFHGVEMRGQVVVMFDLRGELLACQSQYVFYKLITQIDPVFLRESNHMRVEIAGGATELGRYRNLYELFYLVFDALYKNHYFFTQSCRTRG